jgi:hypothetical protein
MEKFLVTTSAQVERTYAVEADNEDQAKKRLRTHMSDPGMLRDGVVKLDHDSLKNVTPEKIKSARKASRPKVVEEEKPDSKAS